MGDEEMAEDVEKRLADLLDKAETLRELGHFRSKDIVCREIRRVAKAEGRLNAYLHGCFNLINFSEASLDFQQRADVSIELIALLENEDHARLIQPDFPEGEYAHSRTWMTTCAYDSLAVATGHLKGFNSEGMHNCIADGIEICRRVGRLEDVAYFRDTATQIYTAADDLEMARHFAKMRETNVQHDPGGYRFTGVIDQARTDLLQGDLDSALVTVTRAWELAEIFHTPAHARRDAFQLFATVLLMMGREAEMDALMEETGTPRGALQWPPPGENPEFDFFVAKNDSLRLCIGGKFDEALAILNKYDRLFEQRKCLHEWFDNRLRILAALRLAGRDDATLLAHAKEPESRARIARDWLTLRRLARLLDRSIPATPLALLGDVSAGPYAVAATTRPEAAARAEEADSAGPTEPVEISPWQSRINEFFGRLSEADADTFPAESAAVQGEILGIDPAEVPSGVEAIPLLYLVRRLADEESDLKALWAWASKLVERFPKDAEVMSQGAAFGLRLSGELGIPPEGNLAPESLEAMFRKSLDLDSENAGNFARAGWFYLEIGKDGEAERCLARAFRLDRSSGLVAKKLADVYSASGRSRDALAVLDLCLREGSDDADVSWDAVLITTNLGQWELCVSYCDHFEANRPGEPWVLYYKATALLELGRGKESLEAAEEEGRRNPEAPFPSRVLEACALSIMGDSGRYRGRLSTLLDGRLSEVTYLTQRGRMRLHELLWKSAQVLDRDEALMKRLEDHMLATGLAPDDLFEPYREGGEIVDGVNAYRVTLDQPLGDDWAASHSCAANETGWTGYRVPWGVLARDEDQARAIALGWQTRCYPIAAEVVSVELEHEDFRDAVGVIWQGLREPPDESESESE